MSSEEVPPNSAASTASATLLLSRDGDRADVSVTVSGLATPPTGCHIHRGARGVIGPIIFFIWGGPADGPFAQASANLGRTWLPVSTETRSQGLTAQNLADLRAGNLYVNVHTQANKGGEIRGQLVRQ